MALAGIILAAGESRRMGTPKGLLRLEGRTFLEVIFGRMKAAGLGRVIAVVGAGRDRIRNEVRLEGMEWVVNEDYTRGQLSSLWCGLEAIGDEAGAVMTLVDHPLVKVETYEYLVNEFKTHPQSVVVPQIGGRTGHPIVFGREHFARFLEAPLEVGARWVLGRETVQVRKVPVADPGVRADIDTPDDLRRLIGEGVES